MAIFRLMPLLFFTKDFTHGLVFHEPSVERSGDAVGGLIEIIDFGEPALEPYHPHNIYSPLISASSYRDAAQLTEGRLVGSSMGDCVKFGIFCCANRVPLHPRRLLGHVLCMRGCYSSCSPEGPRQS
jgi:hypothetical protein